MMSWMDWDAFEERIRLSSFLSAMPGERWVINWLRRRDGLPPLRARAARSRMRVLDAQLRGKPSKGGPA